jgi:hypothetical protein
MYRYFFRFVVTTLTILTANLVTNAISNYMISYKTSYKPLTFSLIAMGIIVIVFYPLFTWLEEWITRISVKAISKGSSLAGKYFGLLLSFLLGMIILLYFYAKMWYHIDLFTILFQGRIREFF